MLILIWYMSMLDFAQSNRALQNREHGHMNNWPFALMNCQKLNPTLSCKIDQQYVSLQTNKQYACL